MSLLLESAVKASLIMLAALAAVACLRRRSAALRHWILSAGMAAAILTPLLGQVMPAWRIPLGPLPRPLLATAAPSVPRAALARPAPSNADAPTNVRLPALDAGQLVATAWLAGAGGSALILLIGLGRLAWVASSARRITDGPWASATQEIARAYGLRRPVAILQSDHPALLVTWGFISPKVILPRAADDWTDARIRVVLSHELAHIKRGDWLIQMLAEIMRAGYWFNPVMWIACRRLRLESEQATDDAVLRHGINGSEYASHLLELARGFARHRPWVPAPAIARPSSLERRISAMLNTGIDRAPITRTARAGIVAALFTVAIAVASAQGAFSTFSGTVFDPLNGYLPGVTMTLTDAQSGAKHEIRSDRTGHFEFVGLPPGSYSLQAILPGFSVLTGTLEITGRDVQRDVTLKVGQLQETITVTPGSRKPAVSTASAAVRAKAQDTATAMKACAESAGAAGAMGGNLKQPMKLVDVKPRYPEALAEAGAGGVLTFAARIGTNGTIVDLQPTSTGANPDLEQAAATAIRQWEFTPTLLNCVAIEVPMTIAVTFKPAA